MQRERECMQVVIRGPHARDTKDGPPCYLSARHTDCDISGDEVVSMWLWQWKNVKGECRSFFHTREKCRCMWEC